MSPRKKDTGTDTSTDTDTGTDTGTYTGTDTDTGTDTGTDTSTDTDTIICVICDRSHLDQHGNLFKCLPMPIKLPKNKSPC